MFVHKSIGDSLWFHLWAFGNFARMLMLAAH